MNVGFNLLFSGAISAIITGGFQLYIKSKAEKELESYKQKLTIHTENLKFELQRRSHDFNLYSVKRHELYPHLCKLLLIAHGNIRALYGLRSFLSFDEFSKSDIKAYMENRKIVEGKASSILANWETNKKNAVEELRSYLRILDINDAESNLIDARNYLLISDIFLSKSVTAMSGEALEDISMVLTYTKYPEHGTHVERERLNEKIDSLLIALKEQMKKELAVSYYEDEEIK
ncbi:hypothetical protein BSK49_19140 [Paenibacillus odorifer]|uniref:Uncharacterized protein n=1 Tax=Paenibacillus odorifer TaxID=189426 RepID=A0ABX3GQ90_9BACL|nr:hypothetical protein [Paenibacillus odorifer]OMD34656.1 hypothetical protein BSO21_10855 [Paenibacillus odorifer]OMD85633.1 hypothetical protein BSK49_19140 [Paenibacillus odorifer]